MLKKLAVFVLALLIAQNSYGAIISYDQLDNSSTMADINTAINRIYIDYDGNTDGDNLAEGAVTSNDIATAVNPLVREYEIIGEYVYTGLTLPTTGATATGSITSGTAYIGNDSDGTLHRVVMGAYIIGTSLTASKDNWIYLDYTGAYSVSIVAIGGAQPTTPDNSILLGYITTGATTITTASENARQTVPPALRQYQDYRNGLVMSYDTAATLVVTPGEIDLGASGGLRRNTSQTGVTWADLDTGAEAASTYYYVHAYPDAANATNIAYKISLSTTDATGVTNERLINWFYNDGSSNISEDGCYIGDGSGVPNSTFSHGRNETGITVNDTSYGTDFETGAPNSIIYFYSSGRPVYVDAVLNVKYSGGAAVSNWIIDFDGDDIVDSTSTVTIQADGTDERTIPITYQMDKVGLGPHTIKIQGLVNANAILVKGWRIRITEL